MRVFRLLTLSGAVFFGACGGAIAPGAEGHEEAASKPSATDTSPEWKVTLVGGPAAPDHGSGTPGGGAVDARADVRVVDGAASESGVVDAAAGVRDAASIDAGCKTDAGPIAVTDATMGAGSTTTGACLACARAHCAAETTACESDCTCRSHFENFFACAASGATTTKLCGITLNYSTMVGGDLAHCVIARGCATACAYP